MVAEITGKNIQLPVGEIHDFHDSHDQGNPDGGNGVDDPDDNSIGDIHEEFSHKSPIQKQGKGERGNGEKGFEIVIFPVFALFPFAPF